MPRVGSRQASLNKPIWFTLLCCCVVETKSWYILVKLYHFIIQLGIIPAIRPIDGGEFCDFNPPKISQVILLTACRTILMMLVLENFVLDQLKAP